MTWTAQALDDGFGVGGATFTAGGHTVHANASGKAKLTGLPHGSAKAAAPAMPAPLSKSPSGLR